MLRNIARLASLSLLTLVMIASTGLAKGPERFVDTDDYKKGDYDKGIIKDYTDMVEGDGVEWVWVAPGIHLDDYRIKIGDFKNMSDVSSHRINDTLVEKLNDRLERAKGSKGSLSTEGAIYWAEKQNEGKSWIPFAGSHLAQAGVGVEMIFRDSNGKVVAKIRHSAREGSDVTDAAEQVADDIGKFVLDN